MNIQNIQLNFSSTQIAKGWEKNIDYQKISRAEENDQFKGNRVDNGYETNERKLLVPMRDQLNKKHREL